jgi:hypothetical protein
VERLVEANISEKRTVFIYRTLVGKSPRRRELGRWEVEQVDVTATLCYCIREVGIHHRIESAVGFRLS